MMMEVKILEQSCLRIERLFFLSVVLQKIKNKKDKYIRVCRLKNGHLYRSSAVSNGAH